MNTTTYYIILTAVISVLFTLFLGGMSFVIYLVSQQIRLRKNPIDIDIYEFNKTGCILRHEIGRKEFHQDYGFCIVTAGKGTKIKEYLGNVFSDNDLIPSKDNGFLKKNRKYMAVAVKDGIFASLTMLEHKNDVFTDAELTILNSFVSKVEIKENPTYFSLNPVKSEQTRFVLDINKELQEKYLKDENIEMVKSIIKNGMWLLGIGFIVLLVMFIVFMTQGGSMLEAIPKAPLPPG